MRNWTTYLVLLIAMLGVVQPNALFAQSSPLLTINRLFSMENAQSSEAVFHSDARITVIRIDDKGNPAPTSIKPEAFIADINRIQESFDLDRQPVVLVEREYGGMTTYFTSVASTFTDLATGESFLLKSVYSIVLVKEEEWKIIALSIQQESPNYPLPSDLWPDDLTLHLKDGRSVSESEDVYEAKDFYNEDEVDIKPEYPGKESLLPTLMESFDVSKTPSDENTPFTVMIGEDGLAEVHYVGDLSGNQIERAKSFVNSMLIWYPAIKNEASVRCKLIFYIQ